MARFHIAAALGAATLAILVILHLISYFGLPALDFMHLTNDASTIGSPANQYSINPPYNEGPGVANDETLYLLGVGKADITGYSSRV